MCYLVIHEYDDMAKDEDDTLSDEGLTTQGTMETPPRRITRSMIKGEDPSSMSLSLFSILIS